MEIFPISVPELPKPSRDLKKKQENQNLETKISKNSKKKSSRLLAFERKTLVETLAKNVLKNLVKDLVSFRSTCRTNFSQILCQVVDRFLAWVLTTLGEREKNTNTVYSATGRKEHTLKAARSSKRT